MPLDEDAGDAALSQLDGQSHTNGSATDDRNVIVLQRANTIPLSPQRAPSSASLAREATHLALVPPAALSVSLGGATSENQEVSWTSSSLLLFQRRPSSGGGSVWASPST